MSLELNTFSNLKPKHTFPPPLIITSSSALLSIITHDLMPTPPFLPHLLGSCVNTSQPLPLNKPSAAIKHRATPPVHAQEGCTDRSINAGGLSLNSIDFGPINQDGDCNAWQMTAPVHRGIHFNVNCCWADWVHQMVGWFLVAVMTAGSITVLWVRCSSVGGPAVSHISKPGQTWSLYQKKMGSVVGATTSLFHSIQVEKTAKDRHTVGVHGVLF